MIYLSFREITNLYYSLEELSMCTNLTQSQRILRASLKAHLDNIDDCYKRERVTENSERKT